MVKKYTGLDAYGRPWTAESIKQAELDRLSFKVPLSQQTRPCPVSGEGVG